MYSINEWDKLEKVIVGVADHARIPIIDKSLRTINYADLTDISEIKIGPYPQEVIDEANEDLDKFSNFLKSCNVEVVRPHRTLSQYYNFCPRDSVIIHGNRSIVAPMPLTARYKEYLSYVHHLENIYEIENIYKDDIYNEDCIGNPDILSLTDEFPKFDAANIIRANDDLLYLVSNTGNKKGAGVLQEVLGYNIKVHTLENVYSYIHIDSTIAFLREGLMLINPDRIKDVSILPYPFNKWDYIVCPEPVDIGYYSGYCNASKWINMNLFSVDTDLVVLEENQDPLRKELNKFGINCEMLPMRHQRTLGGGFHCVTLDLKRKSK